ncbi:MAG: LamG domain-containing protein [Bacteroidota bacterium]
MKQIFPPLLLAMLMLSFISNPNSLSLQNGLVAHYNFNNCDAKDISGNGSDGELFGGVTCWCGIEDDGLLLDGVDDFVEFHGIVNRYFTTSDFTLSFYIRSDRYSLFDQSLFSKREDCGEDYVLDFSLNRNQKSIKTKVQESEYRGYKDISPDIKEGGWYHVALVREGQEAHTYINGYLQKSVKRCSGVDLSNDAILSFSNSPCLGGRTQRFKGILDEVRIYDRALSESELEAIYKLTPIEKAYADCMM